MFLTVTIFIFITIAIIIFASSSVKSGKRVVIAAHGNSLRALVKYLDNIPEDVIAELNIPTGQ